MIRGSRPGSRGHTVVELAVAMTVLAAGTAVLWYGLRSSARMDRMNRLHHAALAAARSDLETIRLLPKMGIHDTAYPLAGPGGEPLRLVREVFDSARIMSGMDDIALDDKLSPMELRKPLEVKVRVFLKPESPEAISIGPFDGDDHDAHDKGAERVLVSLILKLPEYKWY